MANIVPGALWRPIDVGNRAARRKGRGLIGHVAVSNSTLLIPGPLATRASDWTFYLPKNPYPSGERFAQLIDLDLQCWSSAAGNATCPAFESEGGMGTSAQVNAEPWTDNQVESAAIILAHLNRTEGVPLQDMVNSLAASRGFGVHRYGISPWRVAGGEVWSSSNGKLCPGDAKVRQIPQIIARAKQLVTGAAASTPMEGDDMKVIQSTGRGIALVGAGYYRPLSSSEEVNAAGKAWGAPVVGSDREFDLWVDLSVGGKSADTAKLVQILGTDPDGNGQDRLGDLWEQADRNKVELLAALVGQTSGAVDPAALAAMIPDDIAEQVAAKLAERLQS